MKGSLLFSLQCKDMKKILNSKMLIALMGGSGPRVRVDQIFYDQYTIRVLKDPRNKKKEKKEKEIILYYLILN